MKPARTRGEFARTGRQVASSGCTIKPHRCISVQNRKLSFTAPADNGSRLRRVRFRSRQARALSRAAQFSRSAIPAGLTWPLWLVDDQREPSGRTDVLTFTSDVLSAPIKISGQPVANLVASTSGTDSDWVVKLIDVYPDEVAAESWMGGYQLMISADIFRGRYRESLENPKAIASDKPLLYRFALPNANHVFFPGTASWCKSSPVGSRCTIETRKRSCQYFLG